MKNENKGIMEEVLKLLLMTWIYFLIGFIIQTFAVVFLGFKNIEVVILLLLSVFLGIEGAQIGYRVSKQVKKLKTNKRKELMKGQMIFIGVFIGIVLIAAVICTFKLSTGGLLYCICFMIGLLIWEIGAYLGYKSLENKENANVRKKV